MGFLIRWLITAIAVGIAVWIIPGIVIIGGESSWIAIAIFALFLSLINVSIKPLLQLFSLPITVFTLGIFYLVINTFMLYLAAWLANGIFHVGFVIDGFGWAFLASIIISVVSAILNALIAPSGTTD